MNNKDMFKQDHTIDIEREIKRQQASRGQMKKSLEDGEKATNTIKEASIMLKELLRRLEIAEEQVEYWKAKYHELEGRE